jgi:sulfur carrier protein
MTTMTTSTTPLSFSLNGRPVDAHDGTATLQSLLRAQGYDADAAAFACAVNGRFVPRGDWPRCALQPGDRVDVVAPVTGG